MWELEVWQNGTPIKPLRLSEGDWVSFGRSLHSLVIIDSIYCSRNQGILKVLPNGTLVFEPSQSTTSRQLQKLNGKPLSNAINIQLKETDELSVFALPEGETCMVFVKFYQAAVPGSPC